MNSKNKTATRGRRGFTLVELLMVIAVLGVIAAVILPKLARPNNTYSRTYCVNNLKQVGLAFGTWKLDNGDRFPMEVPVNEGGTNFGTMDFTNGISTYRHFLVMSNELSTPKILICPQEKDPQRTCATTFTVSGQPMPGNILFNSNSNLSYFVGLDASDTKNPKQILAGDRNLTNGFSLRAGVMDSQPGQPFGWQQSHHMVQGNVALSDGSVQQMSSSRLRSWISDNALTNRLSMPVLQ
jgi:prepilin-type N-terminal cleavage/methylation domain-containing protein